MLKKSLKIPEARILQKAIIHNTKRLGHEKKIKTHHFAPLFILQPRKSSYHVIKKSKQ